MADPFLDINSLLVVIADVARRVISEDDHRSRIELVRFSGKESDVIRSDAAVYLRCYSERKRDGDGLPTPLVARLLSVGSLWTVPDAECELVVFQAEETARAIGAAYVLPIGVTPPSKLEKGVKSFLKLGSSKLLIEAASFMFKAVGVTLSLDDGKLVLAFPNGTRFEATAAGFTFIVVDAVGIATAHVINAGGVQTNLAPLGVAQLVFRLDGATGSVLSQGLGVFSAKHATGFLGVTPTMPVGYGVGAGSLASGTWFIQP